MTTAEQKQRVQNIARSIGAAILCGGIAAFTRGAWLAWHPAGWMVAGLAVASPAFLWLYNDVRSSKA